MGNLLIVSGYDNHWRVYVYNSRCVNDRMLHEHTTIEHGYNTRRLAISVAKKLSPDFKKIPFHFHSKLGITNAVGSVTLVSPDLLSPIRRICKS